MSRDGAIPYAFGSAYAAHPSSYVTHRTFNEDMAIQRLSDAQEKAFKEIKTKLDQIEKKIDDNEKRMGNIEDKFEIIVDRIDLCEKTRV